ncbi:hypothetical protein [Bifidobacterium samirii]|uniref:Uncharacterized protein n=1 Tax=Bifidobacterium samirii TaxID=2306974 RepID=A0A430FW26_9BIFI|nr:hypothetical protein [Bifidobacterium samirii]RSX58396.1 hypothetical protein D2E24_0275 [Bifidobacterium samirii]
MGDNRQDAAREAAAQEGATRGLLATGAAYAVLAVAGVALAALTGMSDTRMAWPMLVVAVALMGVLARCTPLRDGVPGRVVALACGVASAFACASPRLGWMLFGDGGDAALRDVEAWFAAVGGLLVVLVVVSFGRQMAREERSNLIRGLSHSVLDGIAMIAATGWWFLPGLLAAGFAGPMSAVWIVACVALVGVAVVFAVAGATWLTGMDAEEGALHPELGMGVLPVMLCGAAVPVAALIVAIV